MTLDTQISLTESSFYNQNEWLEEYEYGKSIFYSEYDNDKNCKVPLKNMKAAAVIRRSYPLHIAVASYFSCFFFRFLQYFSASFRL